MQWALWASIRVGFLAIFSLEGTFSPCLKSIFGCRVASAVNDSCWVSRIFLFLTDDLYYLWLIFPDKGSKEVLDLKNYLTSSNEPLGWRGRKLSFFSTNRVNKKFLKLQWGSGLKWVWWVTCQIYSTVQKDVSVTMKLQTCTFFIVEDNPKLPCHFQPLLLLHIREYLPVLFPSVCISTFMLSISTASKSACNKDLEHESQRNRTCAFNASIWAIQMSLIPFQHLKMMECKVSLCASLGLCTLHTANPPVLVKHSYCCYQKPAIAIAVTH